MKHIKKEHLPIIIDPLTAKYFTEETIFFDIETTGFSPASSDIYLIGCMYKEGENHIIEQFFAESEADEKAILEGFLESLNKHKTIISFNGIGFDLPFIRAKCNAHQIPEHLGEFHCVDIFKLINNFKSLLKLPNYKQKTLENFLGLKRKDQFTGGELINVYYDYKKTGSADAEHLLLLHNYEDVLGMSELLPILSYPEVLNGNFSVFSAEVVPYTTYDGETAKEMILTLTNGFLLPKRVSHQCMDYYITMNQEFTRIRIPVYEGELRYFYPNYKDYYYLPQEDKAIHKSVATFVDKEYRENAKASNCYTRKTSSFLPQYDAVMNPFFLKEHKDKCSYFELTDDFMASDEMLKRYAEHIFRLFLKQK